MNLNKTSTDIWHQTLKCCAYLLVIILISSCAGKEYDGDGYKNYPDLKTILDENFKAMTNANSACKLVTMEGEKRDTVNLTSSSVQWNEWKEEMMKADINKEVFDRQYKIEVITDTVMGTLTYMYNSLKPDNFTKKIIITSRSWDNAITSVYAETHDEGFFMNYSSKILFAFGKSLQIQELNKKPFQKKKESVKTLVISHSGE